MKFISTNDAAPAVDLQAALLAGLAPDGGLYVPEVLPRRDLTEFDGATALPDIARVFLTPFFEGDPLLEDLPAICAESLDIETPMVNIAQDTFLLELFHGPTAAFKDYGARFLARTLGRMREISKTTTPLTILVATSGDTGSAVAAAFHQRPGFQVVILFPEGRVSKRQAHQLGCFGDNIVALRVPSGFDPCQAMVKQAFNDAALAGSGAALFRQQHQPRPSAASGHVLRLCFPPSFPCDRRTAFVHRTHRQPRQRGGGTDGATVRFAHRAGSVRHQRQSDHSRVRGSGDYRGRPSLSTLANAMDVGDPSNVARLRFMMKKDHTLSRPPCRYVGRRPDDRGAHPPGEADYGRVFCPHTACAIEMLEQQRRARRRETFCVVATAHPCEVR
jgi:threonine synthase